MEQEKLFEDFNSYIYNYFNDVEMSQKIDEMVHNNQNRLTINLDSLRKKNPSLVDHFLTQP